MWLPIFMVDLSYNLEVTVILPLYTLHKFLKGKGCKRHYTRCSGVGGNIFGDVEMAGQSDDTINLSTNGFQ